MSVSESITSSIVDSISESIFGQNAVNDFIFVMATTAPSETVTIPCQNVGAFDAVIDWGDGSTSAITAYNDADLAHVYADAGDHEIHVSGTFPNIYFNGAGDRLKVKEVLNLGKVGWTRLNGAFYGCENMVRFIAGNCDTSLVITVYSLLRGCFILTDIRVSTMDVSSSSNFGYVFRDCPTGIDPGIESWDISLGASFTHFMKNSGLTTPAYDATLEAWGALDPVDSQSPHFGISKYTAGGAAEAGRDKLIGTDLWTFIDGGAV